MSDRRWCEWCESVQPDDGFPCQRCEARAEEAKANAPMPPDPYDVKRDFERVDRPQGTP